MHLLRAINRSRELHVFPADSNNTKKNKVFLGREIVVKILKSDKDLLVVSKKKQPCVIRVLRKVV